MGKYSISGYSFDTEEEYKGARDDYAFEKTVKEKYDIENDRVRKLILERFRPKSIIGEKFVEELKAIDEDSIDSIFDEIDTAIEEDDATHPKKITCSIKQHDVKMQKVYKIMAATILISSAILITIAILAIILQNYKKPTGKNDTGPASNNNNRVEIRNSDENSQAATYGDMVHKGNFLCYVLPADCSGNNSMLSDSSFIQVYDMKLEDVTTTNWGSFNFIYSGCYRYLGTETCSSISMTFAFLDNNDNLITEENAGFVSMPSFGDSYKTINSGESHQFSVEVGVTPEMYSRVSKLALTGISYY